MYFDKWINYFIGNLKKLYSFSIARFWAPEFLYGNGFIFGKPADDIECLIWLYHIFLSKYFI